MPRHGPGEAKDGDRLSPGLGSLRGRAGRLEARRRRLSKAPSDHNLAQVQGNRTSPSEPLKAELSGEPLKAELSRDHAGAGLL